MTGKDKYKRAFPRKKCPSLFVRSLLGAMPYVRAPRGRDYFAAVCICCMISIPFFMAASFMGIRL